MADTGAPPRADSTVTDVRGLTSKVPCSTILAEAGKRRAFATWGTVLYWWAAMLYIVQVKSLIGNTASSLRYKARP